MRSARCTASMCSASNRRGSIEERFGQATGTGAMKLPLTGGCLCGALRYEVGEAPLMTYTCHCTDCQHITSSAFSLAITVRDSAFRLTKGEPRPVQRTADSGRIVTRWLCPECGC